MPIRILKLISFSKKDPMDMSVAHIIKTKIHHICT